MVPRMMAMATPQPRRSEVEDSQSESKRQIPKPGGMPCFRGDLFIPGRILG